VARHSLATRVDVSLRARDGEITLSVSDDGRGFNIRHLTESEGLGVAGMRERSSIVGGQLDVVSRPGEGTRVYFRVPLPSDDQGDASDD